MAIEYFGMNLSPVGDSTLSSGVVVRNKNITATCPGTGSMTVKEISCYKKYNKDALACGYSKPETMTMFFEWADNS